MTKAEKRQQWPRVREVQNHGQTAYMVDARKKGKGERFFYDTLAAADQKADDLRAEQEQRGSEAVAFPTRLRTQALEAARRLAEVDATIDEAVEYFLKHARPPSGPKTVAAVADEFLRLKAQAGRGAHYVSCQAYFLKGSKDGPSRFAATFGEKLVHEVGHEAIEVWMGQQGWSPRSRLNYYRDMRNFFGFAMRRGYCASNPLGRMEKPTVPAKAPGILTVKQAEDLLGAAVARGGSFLPAVAIGLFCGLRSAEIERLDWSRVDLQELHIEVTAETAKMSERRIVTITPELAEWLRPYAKLSGPVAPRHFDWHLGETWKTAGIAKWPKNAMRHSFASYHFAQHQNAGLTTAQLGHFGDLRTFVASYRNVVKPAEAAKFWKLAPGKPGNVVAMPARAA